MGYILPITHYTYKNYQNRMKEKKESPHFIGSTYKVVFHKISSEYEDQEKGLDILPLTEQVEEGVSGGIDFFHISKRQKAKITGKGGNINAQI